MAPGTSCLNRWTSWLGWRRGCRGHAATWSDITGTGTTVGPEREASKQGCPSHARSAASQPRAGPRSCAGHSAPRSRRPPTHGTHDLDGAPAPGVWLIASQSACSSRCERARLISLSARIAAGGCVSSPAPTVGCDATRCDAAHQAAVARWPSHGMSPGSRGRQNSARAGPGRPFTDARRATGSPGSP